MLDLAIIVVTHNSSAIISRCLALIGSKLRSHVLVVDNGSTDDTVARVRKCGAKVIVQQKNLGFARAANIAASVVKERYLCFLNPDCESTSDLFQEGVRALEGHPARCAVPTLVEEGGQLVEGRQPGYTHIKLVADMLQTSYGDNFLNRWMKDLPGYDDTHWWWPHGAALFISRECFLKLDGFDTRFFLYMEDVDLGRRLTALGGEVVTLNLRLIHHRGQSSAISQIRHLSLLNRGRIRYARIHYGWIFSALLALLGFPGLALRVVFQRVS